MKKSLVILLCSTVLSACSSQQLFGSLYSSAQNWQRDQCVRIADHQERERCMASTSKTYEEYKAQSGAAKDDK